MMPWLSAFIWTLVVELPVYELGGKSPPLPWWHMPLVALGLNVLTHPLFSWWTLVVAPPDAVIFIAEVLISIVEGFVLLAVRRDLGASKALVLAVCANGASYGLGILAVS